MTDLKCGDVCICDLSLSINSYKYAVVPLVYISVTYEKEMPIYSFCRVGKAPRAYSRYPFVDVTASNCVRKGSAVYPTQVVLFSDEMGIIKKIGCLSQSEISKVLNVQQQKKETSVALVMALCPRCRRDFMTDPTSVVIRMDPFAVQETQCDYCQVRNGHTYIIYKRKLYGRSIAR